MKLSWGGQTPIRMPAAVQVTMLRGASDNAAPTVNPLDSSMDQAWLESSSRLDDHAKMVANLRNKLSDKSLHKSSGPALREHQAVFDPPVPVIQHNPGD